MKKITLLLTLLTASIGFSQNHLTNGDFSDGATGWVLDGGGTVVSGEAYFATTNAGGNPWETQLVQNGITFTAGTSYTLSFKARAAANRDIKVAIQNFGSWENQTSDVVYSLTTTMQTFEQTFNAASNNSNVNLGFLLANMGSTDAVYIDDVELTGGTPVVASPPTVAAPTPPSRAAADVVSIYSDAYTSISPINLDAGWCGAGSVEATTADSNNILFYKDQTCQGIDFDDPATVQDLTGFTHIYVDFFIQAGTDLVGKVFNLKVVGPSPTGSDDTVIPIDINGLSPAPVPGTWYTYDKAITLTNTSMRQFAITSNLNSVVWYDNLHLHKNTTLNVEGSTVNAFKSYPNPTKNAWTIKSDNGNITAINVFDILGKNVLTLKPNTKQANINATNLKTGLYFAKIEGANGTSTLKLVKE